MEKTILVLALKKVEKLLSSYLKKQDIEKLAKLAAAEGNPVYPVPVLFGAKQLERFYYDVLEEGGTRP